jgi:CheY-like chemotaxis protein
MKVLLVEDSKFLRVATERTLSQAGYEVVCASDGEDALEMAREKRPDVILLDMLLPKMAGPDVLKALKKDPATAGIAVMVLTSLSQKNAKALEKDGAAGFFEKSDLMLGSGPVSLVAAIEKMLKNVK